MLSTKAQKVEVVRAEVVDYFGVLVADGLIGRFIMQPSDYDHLAKAIVGRLEQLEDILQGERAHELSLEEGYRSQE